MDITKKGQFQLLMSQQGDIWTNFLWCFKLHPNIPGELSAIGQAQSNTLILEPGTWRLVCKTDHEAKNKEVRADLGMGPVQVVGAYILVSYKIMVYKEKHIKGHQTKVSADMNEETSRMFLSP